MEPPNPAANLFVRARIAASTPNFLQRQPRPVGSGPTLVPGPDPLRILLSGAGLAVGYGVRRDGLAVPGQLAHAIAPALRRGVIVDRRTDPSLSLGKMPRFLGTHGAAGYAVAIYMPGFRELTQSHTRHWQRNLRRLIDHFRETGGEQLTVVLGGIPLSETPVSPQGVERARDTNAELHRCAQELPGVLFVMPPSYSSLVIRRVFGPDYYRRYSASIADVLIPHLRAEPDAP